MFTRFLSPILLGLLLLAPVTEAVEYRLGPDSLERAPGVPKGRVEKFEFTESKVFPDTRREVWVYVPAQYDGSRPAALMVFQDGAAYVGETGQQRVPLVYDNLIARGELPVTVCVFVNPGTRSAPDSPAGSQGNRSNRSFEYDSLGDAYARFLIDELLPEVVRRFEVRISDDPAMRGIGGMSSGAICAFTVAWERPGSFGRVLSQIGSFTNIRGGHNYPAFIRKTERKPIRVFLQDGSNDLNNLHGNWPLANQQMASALAFAGYDFRFVMGEGGHSGQHGGAILPDSLRWLWRADSGGLPAPITRDNLRGDEALSKVLADGGRPGDWELVGEGYGFTDAACADAEGNFYFSDLPRGTLHRVPAAGGAPEPWLEKGPKISGMKFGSDGFLYAATQGELEGPDSGRKRIVSIDPSTRAIATLATGVNPNDLVVSRAGRIYFTDTGAGQVISLPATARDLARPPVAAGGIRSPNGIALTPDETQLVVSEHGGTNAWTFLIATDGSLRGGERNLELRTPAGRPDSGGDGMITDEAGRSWITSHLGIQMFDPNGRMGGIVSRPDGKGLVSCAFAGSDGSWLYVCAGDRVYRRRTLTRGAGGRPAGRP